MFKIQKKLRAWRRSEAQHCSSLCSQSEGNEYSGGQTRLKIQRRYALKRWPYSLRVRGPHFASKVSYNDGAATDDYAGKCKTPLRGRCRLFANGKIAEVIFSTLLKAKVIRQAKKKCATRGRDSCYSRPQGRRITLWYQFGKERTVPSCSLSFCLHAALSFILFYPC